MKTILALIFLLWFSAIGLASAQMIEGTGKVPGAPCGDAAHALNWNGADYGCQAIVGAALPGGNPGNPQYNNAGAMGGVANVIHAAAGTLPAAFAALGANPGVVIADPGQVYTVAAPLTWGTTNDQTLVVEGRINCTDVVGGRDCLDIDVHGHLVGNGPGSGSSSNGCMITDSAAANITSLVTNANHAAADGFDLRNCLLDPNTASTITKGELWLSGAQGFNTISNVRFTQPPVGGANSGIIYAVDDNAGTRQWNEITNSAVSITCGNAAGATGLNIAGAAGAGGANFTFTGGSIVDCGAASKLLNIAGNAAAQVKNIKFTNTYFESSGTGDLVDITNAYAVDLDNVYFNQAGGGATNCVSITGLAGNVGVVRVTGRAGPAACTNVINNAISSYVKTAAGNIDYKYQGTNGAPISVTDGSQTFTTGPTLSSITSSLLKTNGSGVVGAATAASDYAPATTGLANTPLFNNGAGGFTNGTRTGNTTAVTTFNGAATPGRCLHTDAAGNAEVTGADCGAVAACSGTVPLVNGAATIANVCITGAGTIQLTGINDTNQVYLVSQGAGTASIQSESALDTATIQWGQL